MRKLAKAIKRARKEGVEVPEDLERGLLARSRALVRQDRDRIKAGSITREAAEVLSEQRAVDGLMSQIDADLERITNQDL